MTDCKGAGPESAATDSETRKNVGSGKSRSSKPQPSDPQAAPKSWRDVLPIHPAADLFPLMSPDELQALGEDIKKNGLTSPIVLWLPMIAANAARRQQSARCDRDRTGSRSTVATSIGARTSSHQQGDRAERSVDPYAYVISANIHRRHLTAEQKRELIAKLIKATPEKSDRQIAETVKASPTTVGTVRAKMEAKGEVSKLDTRTDAKGVKQPASKPTRAPPRTCAGSAAAAARSAKSNSIIMLNTTTPTFGFTTPASVPLIKPNSYNASPVPPWKNTFSAL